MKHYLYGGSTAGRTVQCPSWQLLATSLPVAEDGGVGTESEYAKEGTALHTCMEMILEGAVDSPDDLLGKDVNGLDIEDDHVERLNMALEAWDELCKTHKITDYVIEQTYELTEHIGGTADVVAWSNDTVYVVDWKFGQGVSVAAENSAQGMFYAICGSYSNPEIFDDKNIAIAIIQPMPSRDRDTLKTWLVPPKRLKAFRTAFFAAVEYDGEPKYNMGDHCQFCPVAPICPAKTGAAQKALMITPEVSEALAAHLDMALQLESWISSVKALAHEQMEEGALLQGFKLVKKRAMRKWEDPTAIETQLRKLARRNNVSLKVSDCFVAPKLLTPPQVEKVFKKLKLDMGLISDYIISQSSGTTLAREDDAREAIPSAKALQSALDRVT